MKNIKSILKTITAHYFLGLLVLSWFGLSPAFAANRTVNLIVGYKQVNFTGKSREAIAVNNQIPAPTLHFKQGDHITINVYNHLRTETSIHWHGLLLPWQMDGVEGVSQKPISPGGVFHYQFTLYQSGTYWYHAHAGFQEQQGLYGSIIIDPLKPPHYHYTRDEVIVLSDWSNTRPEQIFNNLKKEGDYYSPRFPLQASLMRFIHEYHQAKSPEGKKQVIEDYKMMQQMRMGMYDFSDVAYDAFLLNGQPKTHPWTALVKRGDVVRLRFIGASASTIFRVKIIGASMQMVHVEGNDIRPYPIQDFTIAPGETYDVLVKIQKDSPYIIYAESSDTVGAAVGALITHPYQVVDYRHLSPFPEPAPVTQEMMANMMSGTEHSPMNMATGSPSHAMMNHNSQKMEPPSSSNRMNMNENMSMNHSMDMNMPTEPSIVGDTLSSPQTSQALSTGTKYQHLIAAVKTNDPTKPIQGVIKMELFGYMGRYMWFINGLPEYKAKPIVIEPGKRYRLIFINHSMMHHPMHIHGHWLILRTGHGAYDPLMHTLDVAPGATIVVDFDSDASGQWFFHCHHLYHMMASMARVFQYSTLIDIVKDKRKPTTVISPLPYANQVILREDTKMPIDPSLVLHPMGHPGQFFSANFLDLGEDPFQNIQEITFKGLYGGDYNKLELFTNDAEMKKGTIENADVDIFYWHLISQFWAVKGGMNYTYRPGETPYWQPGIGIEGLMPYFIDTDARTYYHDGSIKLDIELSRDTQITNNFFIRTGVRSILATKTVTQDEIGNGLNQMRYTVRPYYRLRPDLNLFTEFEHDQDYGMLKTLRQRANDSSHEDSITFGISLLF